MSDLAQNFIQEFQKLLLEKPRFNLRHMMAENCEYSDTAGKSKNCYYSFGTFYCEDVFYTRYSRKCVSCSGLTLCANCQWCIECIDCLNCYNSDYCQDCQNCRQCQFCHDCFGCQNCFGCVGLYQKQFHIFNQKFPQDQFEKRISKLDLQNHQHRAFVQQELSNLRKKMPYLALHQFMTENCVGNHISESKNCYQCFDIFASEDCLYNIEANGNKNCCDLTVCFESEWCYSCVQSPFCNNCNFLYQVDNSQFCEFCAYSRNLKDCFGCVYLENKQYHILNKPYSKEAYQKEVEKIRQKLIENKKYNFGIFLASDYEMQRIQNETDPVIQSLIPSICPI